ncbi:MAG TPA: PIN domain-containing protein [Aridibacter sp.]|nr:PIN domain-containing protein [Aridibacter sp.]
MTVNRVYLDTCCFIESVKSEVGNAQPGRESDIWYIKQLLEASKNGDIEVITSYLTIAEFRGVGAPLTDEIKRIIRSVMSSGKIVKLAQLSRGTAELARDLHWVHSINLGGADAVHVATALNTECKEFISFDGGKRKSPLKFFAELKKLGILAVEPARTTFLPPEYRQQKLPHE